MRKLYSYIITADNGISPCYDDNIYTLACCKPQIRRMIYSLYKDEINSDNSDIWVMGVRRDRENNNRPFIVYLANITKVIKLEDYYNNSGIYASRKDCKYRGVKTVEDLPISMDSEDIRFKEYFPDIKALDDNEHSKFDNSEELYKLSKTKRKNVMKDICGRAVLLSSKFIHFSQVSKYDKYALTEMLKPCFSELLKEYALKNQRHNHSFDNWKEFDKDIKKINFVSNGKIKPLDEKNCVCCI